jgi:hypothetical protein
LTTALKEFTLVNLKLKVNLEACMDTCSEIELDKQGITGEHIVTPLRTVCLQSINIKAVEWSSNRVGVPL